MVEGDGWATWHEWCEDKHKVLFCRHEIKISAWKIHREEDNIKKDFRMGGVGRINLAY